MSFFDSDLSAEERQRRIALQDSLRPDGPLKIQMKRRSSNLRNGKKTRRKGRMK